MQQSWCWCPEGESLFHPDNLFEDESGFVCDACHANVYYED